MKNEDMPYIIFPATTIPILFEILVPLLQEFFGANKSAWFQKIKFGGPFSLWTVLYHNVDELYQLAEVSNTTEIATYCHYMKSHYRVLLSSHPLSNLIICRHYKHFLFYVHKYASNTIKSTS